MTQAKLRQSRGGALPTFVALAYGITWLCWIPVLIIATRDGYALPTMDRMISASPFVLQHGRHAMLSIIFSVAAFGPMVAALLNTFIYGGWRDVKRLLNQAGRWRIGLRWYLYAVGLALVMPLLPLVVGILFGIAQYNPNVTFTASSVLILLGSQLLTSGLGEETGWRAYLLPRLNSQYGGDKAIWLCGLVWAIWHYPYTVYSTLNSLGSMALPDSLAVIIPALAGQTMSLIGMTYLYAWLYSRTSSVFLCIVFHALSNVGSTLAFAVTGANQLMTLAVAVMPWLMVFALQRIYRSSDFPGLNTSM